MKPDNGYRQHTNEQTTIKTLETTTTSTTTTTKMTIFNFDFCNENSQHEFGQFLRWKII